MTSRLLNVNSGSLIRWINPSVSAIATGSLTPVSASNVRAGRRRMLVNRSVANTAAASVDETYVDFEALPAGWRNDPVRPEARWTQTLLPGSAATFEMRLRRQSGERADPSNIRVRAECAPIEGGEPWIVNVPVTITPSAADKLPHGRVQTTRPPSQIPEVGSPHLDLPGTRS
jgi:hypothetical protein